MVLLEQLSVVFLQVPQANKPGIWISFGNFFSQADREVSSIFRWSSEDHLIGKQEKTPRTNRKGFSKTMTSSHLAQFR
ncbi:MAG: hypothetical protein DMG35_21810 [Acidobacteria bacterium]|nr:MAG: hypothetical protein DMG35_21810 [Acidobacteriota bacterium]